LFSEGVHHGTNRYEIGDSTLSEEKNIQTDISLSSYGSDSSFGLDVFYNSINDYIYLNPTGTTISSRPVYNYSQADASLFGGELHFTKSTSLEWLSYKTSLEYLSGEKSGGGNLPFISPFTIKHTFNFGFDSNNYKLSFLSKGKQNNVAQFETPTDSYFLMNISGSHKFNLGSNNLGFVWSINNLLDEEYYDHLSRFKNMGIHEMGRNISFGLNYKF